MFYFLAECPLHVFLSPDGALEKAAYLATWRVLRLDFFKGKKKRSAYLAPQDIPNENERVSQLSPLVTAEPNALTEILQRHNIFLIAKRRVNDSDVLYLSARVVLPSKALTTGGEVVLIEITLAGETAKCCIRTAALELVPLFQASLSALTVRSVLPF